MSHPRGPRLTPTQRSELVRERASGVPAGELAARFGVTRRTVERMRAATGRPAKSEAGCAVSTWLPASEARAFDALLGRLGITRSEAVRRLVRSASGILAPDEAAEGEARQVAAEVRRLGHNVNQIARGVNEARLKGQAPATSERAHRELLATIAESHAVADRIVALLGQGGRRAHAEALAALQAASPEPGHATRLRGGAP